MDNAPVVDGWWAGNGTEYPLTLGTTSDWYRNNSVSMKILNTIPYGILNGWRSTVGRLVGRSVGRGKATTQNWTIEIFPSEASRKKRRTEKAKRITKSKEDGKLSGGERFRTAVAFEACGIAGLVTVGNRIAWIKYEQTKWISGRLWVTKRFEPKSRAIPIAFSNNFLTVFMSNQGGRIPHSLCVLWIIFMRDYLFPSNPARICSSFIL